MQERDVAWLASRVRIAPHAARHRVWVGSSPSQQQAARAKPHRAVVTQAETLAKTVYDELNATRVLKLAKAHRLVDDLYRQCQTIQVTLFSLEAFAAGTPFAEALATQRLALGMFKTTAFKTDDLDTRKADAFLPSLNERASAPAAAAAATVDVDAKLLQQPSQKEPLVCTIRSRDAPSFGGPYWHHIPSFQLWLSTRNTAGFAAALDGLYTAYLCALRSALHPSIRHSAAAVLVACVRRYCAALPVLRTAMAVWRQSAASNVMASAAYWDVVNRACFVTGDTTEVMFALGIGPDFVECFLLPELARIGIMTVKTGTRSIVVTRQQMGYGDFSAFAHRDDAATCFALEPEHVCAHLLTSTVPALKARAIEFAKCVQLAEWTKLAHSLHHESDTAKRVYPA